MAERRNGFTHKTKREVREEQRGCCGWCQEPSKGVLEVHHQIPIAHGGENLRENAVGLDKGCHNVMDLIAFRHRVYFDELMERGVEYTIGILNSVPEDRRAQILDEAAD